MPCVSRTKKKTDLFSWRIQNTTNCMHNLFYIYDCDFIVIYLFNSFIFVALSFCIKNRGVRNASCCSISTELKFSQSLRHFHTVDGNAVSFGATAWHGRCVCICMVLCVWLYDVLARHWTYAKRIRERVRVCARVCVCVWVLCFWISCKNTSKHVCQFDSLVPV